MKKLINKILGPFNLELHGKGYLKSLSKGDYDVSEFEFQKKFFDRSDVRIIFDVGANHGGITDQYLMDFPNAVIHLFEPTTKCFDFLKNKFIDHSRVIINKIALTNTIGTAEFYVNNNIDTSSMLQSQKLGLNSDKNVNLQYVEVVDTLTIDEYCRLNDIGHIDILKLDIQGGELNALQGAQSSISKIKLIYTETYFQQQYLQQPLFYEIGVLLNDSGFVLQDLYSKIYGHDSLVWCDAIFINKLYSARG